MIKSILLTLAAISVTACTQGFKSIDISERNSSSRTTGSTTASTTGSSTGTTGSTTGSTTGTTTGSTTGSTTGGTTGATTGSTTGTVQYSLTIVKEGLGRVTATNINCGSTCSANFSAGTPVTLTATAEIDYAFAGWTGNGCTTGTVVMNSNITCYADFNFVFVSQNPNPMSIGFESFEGTQVKINGVMFKPSSGPVSFDWGDGVVTSGFFPQFHTYADQTKNYTVTARVNYQDGSRDAAIATVHFSVPSILTVDSPANGTTASEGFFVRGTCTNGYEITLAGDIENTNQRIPCQAGQYKIGVIFSAGIGTKNITVKSVNVRDEGPRVSQVHTKAEIIETHAGNFVEWRMPNDFFMNSNISISDILTVSDLAWQLETELSNGHFPIAPAPYPAAYQLVEYEEGVFGTNGFPMHMGKYANPVRNHNGDFYFDVFFHEIGHNFFNTTPFFGRVFIPGAFLQEGTACLAGQYVMEKIDAHPTHYGLSPQAADSLHRLLVNSRIYFQGRKEEYVRTGMVYNDAILTSQTITHKMFQMGELFGWDTFKRFQNSFSDSLEQQFTFWQDGVTDAERSAYAVAALSVAFQRDFRRDFRNLNFPIDDNLFGEVCSRVQARVGGTFNCFGAEGPALLPQ